MNFFDSFLKQLQDLRYLKLVYSLVYLKWCLLVAYIHLLVNLDDYRTALDIRKLGLDVLNEVSDNRGIKIDNKFQSNDKASLERLISQTGAIYGSEIKYANLTNNLEEPKVFNSAGEFLECVEDNRDSVWLVHIVMNNFNNDNFPCGRSKFVKSRTWNRLANSYSRFFQVGIFNCARDPYFCSAKGWLKPQLMLAYTDTKEAIKFLYQADCQLNEYEHINKWLEVTLRDRLIYPLTKANSNRIFKKKAFESNSAKSEMKIFYKASSLSPQIPLYFSTISLKYNRRSKFYHFDHQMQSSFDRCLHGSTSTETTPIYLVIDDRTCYNYGLNLNEIPSFEHLNLFLLFLYPDANNIFLISFFVLNSYLIMLFFEYNKSLVNQLLRGLMFLCIFNFVLFSICFFSSEKIRVFSFLNSIASEFLVWLRYFMMYNSLTQRIVSHLRFVVFYHIYIQPYFAIVLYALFLVIYYFHTRLNYQKGSNGFNTSSGICENNEAEQMLAIGYQEITENSNLEIKQQISSQLSSTSPVSLPQLLPPDSDIEISVNELINQINGPTSIWLQSSTHADRLILELPHIRYCKCFYASAVKFHARDETDLDSTDLETEDDSDMQRVKACECGKNEELNKYLANHYDVHVPKFIKKECSICLEKYSYNAYMVMLPCCHTFHRHCLYEWFMNSVSYKLTCPICRSSLHNTKKSV